MTTIVTRAGKGSALTWTEGDDNFTNLNTDKLENIVEDTTPELGGNLVTGSNDIRGNSAGSAGVTVTSTGIVGLKVTNGTTEIAIVPLDEIITSSAGLSVVAASGDLTTQGNNVQLKATGFGGKVKIGTTTTLQFDSGNSTVTTGGAYDLTLNTNNGTNSGAIVIQDGVSGQIQLTPASSGLVFINGQTIGLRTNNTGGAIIGRAATTTTGAYQYPSLTVQKNRTDITTASMTNEPAVILFQTRDSASVNTSFGRLSAVYQGTGTNPYFDLRVSTDGFTTTANAAIIGVGQARFGNSGGGYELTTYGTSNLTLSTDSGANTGKVIVENMVYNEVVYTSGGTTGTITPDAANGTIQAITLTGNITLNAFANPVAGQSISLIVTQPSSGGPYTLTSSMLFAGGSKTLSTAANAVDIISVFYTGSTYLASLSKGYA